MYATNIKHIPANINYFNFKSTRLFALSNLMMVTRLPFCDQRGILRVRCQLRDGSIGM